MAQRSYDQYCGLAKALDVVGERWTPLVVRELTVGPKRFTDLLDGLPGIGRSLLATRLKDLERHDVVRRARLPPPASVKVYELTERGERLAEALIPLQQWGRDFLGEPADQHMRPGWYLIHFMRGLRREHARSVHETYEFRFPGESWHVAVEDGEFELKPGPARTPAVVVTLDPLTFIELGLGKTTAIEAVTSERMAVTGDPAAIARMLQIAGQAEPAGEDVA